jgi:hypothetical protein
MNSKILSLLKDSDFCFWEDEHWGPGRDNIDWGPDYDKEMKLFIELLVNECAKIVDDAIVHGEDPSTYSEKIRALLKSDQ